MLNTVNTCTIAISNKSSGLQRLILLLLKHLTNKDDNRCLETPIVICCVKKNLSFKKTIVFYQTSSDRIVIIVLHV